MAFGGPGSKSSSSMGGPASRADPKRESLAATAGKRQDTGRGRGAEQGRGGRGGGASRGRGGGRGRGADMGVGAARRLKEKAEREQQGGGNLRAMQDRSNKAAQMAADEVKRRHQEIKAATGHDDGKKEKKRRSAAAEEPRVPATKWDLEKFLMALPFDTPPDKLTALTLVNKGIGSLPTQLAFLAHIRRLDLSKNGISDVSPLVKLTGCVQVNLAHNNITTLAPLKDVMPHVTVLNVTANVLTSLDGVQTMAGLKALIAPDNKLTDVSHARRLPLDTLVLSRNTALGASDSLWPVVHSVSSSLRKLSLASCGISALPGSASTDVEKTEATADDDEGGAAGDALQLPLVNELRLSGNNLTEFPRGTMCRSLKILDIASNDFANLGSLRPSRLFLEQIHIHGNPVATFDAEKIAAADAAAAAAGEDRKHTIAHYTFELRNFVGAVFPKVRLLDGQAFAAPSKDERIARRKAAAGDDGATGSDDDGDVGERPSKAAKLEKGKKKKPESSIGHGAAPVAPPKANQTADEIKAELDAKDVVMENPLGEGPVSQAGGKRSYVTKTVQAAARPSGSGGAVGKKVGHSDKDKKKPQVTAQGQSAAAALLQSAASNSIGGW